MESVDRISTSPEETFRLGREFAGGLKPGSVVAISGELGSGKTVLVQGLCSGLGVSDCVTSPSFTLVQEYRGFCPVYHFDFYRLESVREIEDLDLERYFESGGVSLIEWAERAEPLLPDSRVRIRIERMAAEGRSGQNERRILIEGCMP